jgi:hypothetical protein
MSVISIKLRFEDWCVLRSPVNERREEKTVDHWHPGWRAPTSLRRRPGIASKPVLIAGQGRPFWIASGRPCGALSCG